MKYACITVVKNAERSIAEWIAFHLDIGFDTIFILDNASTDATAEVAAKFVAKYDVRIFEWPLTTPDYQVRGLGRVLLECRGQFDWCACIDIDEFIVLPPGRSLGMLLDLPETVSAVAMPWAMFGSNGHIERPSGLIIQNYLHRAGSSFLGSRTIKSIGRPEQIMDCRSPHFLDVSGDYVDMNHKIIDFIDYNISYEPDYAGGKLHHYYVQSKEDWQAKLARGYHDLVRSPKEFAVCDRNEVFDDSALANLAGVQKIILDATG